MAHASKICLNPNETVTGFLFLQSRWTFRTQETVKKDITLKNCDPFCATEVTHPHGSTGIDLANDRSVFSSYIKDNGNPHYLCPTSLE